MNESVPVSARTPVPWGERLVAGLLAARWVVWLHLHGIGPERWWKMIVASAHAVHYGWQIALGMRTADPSLLLESPFIVNGIAYGLWMSRNLGIPILIVWGFVVASGRGKWHRPTGWWWLVFAHGAMAIMALLFQGRAQALFPPDPVEPLHYDQSWHRGWLIYFIDSPARGLSIDRLLLAIELLLAPLVLGVGWWKRREREATRAS
jgi:hypothetical protein